MKVLFALLSMSATLTAFALEPPFLRIGLPVEPATLQWNKAQTSTELFIATFLMRGMTRKSQCDLCERMEKNPDGLAYKFTLKKINWSDGVALKSQDFIAPWSAIEGVAKVSAPSPSVVQLELKKPIPSLPEILAQPKFFPNRASASTNPPTLGPYVVAEWEKNDRLVLEGNPQFADPRPVYRVEFYFGSREQNIKRIRSGKLDVFSGPTTEEALKTPSAKVQLNPYLATRALVPNFRSDKMRDIGIRRALAYALNRRAIQSHLKNGEKIATSLIPPSLPGHRDTAFLGEDTAAAQKLWVEKPELKVKSDGRYEERQLLRWLEECLRSFGVKIQAVTGREQDYDLALITYELRSSLPDELLSCFKSNAPCNSGAWTNVGYDATLDTLSEKKTESETLATYEKLSHFLEYQEVAVIPLTYPVKSYLLGPRVSRFSTTPYGMPDLLQIALRK